MNEQHHDHTQRAGPDPRGPAAEAAVWLTLLHGEGRTPELEREFSAWLAASAANRQAFERATGIWEDVRGIAGASVLARDYSANMGRDGARAPQRPGSRNVPAGRGTRAAGAGSSSNPRGGRRVVPSLRPQLLAMCSLLLVVVVLAGTAGWRAWQRPADLVTARGEQRTVVFDDGSRVMLNTQTKVSPLLHRDGQRVVALTEGEAYFEVAKDPAHPFIVTVAGKQVVALGTAFVVKAVAGDVTVTLLEGKVLVDEAGAPAPAGGFGAGQGSGTVLTPGQSLRLRAKARAATAEAVVGQQSATTVNTAAVPVPLSGSQLTQAASWRRGEMIFDETPLADALAEVNRYSSTSVELNATRPPPQGLKVSGVFRIGDSEAFARAVAAVHGLKLDMADKRVRLAAAQPAN